MDDQLFALIDSSALTVCADLELIAASIDGIYARQYREDPTVRGLQSFLHKTSGIPDSAYRQAAVGLHLFESSTALFRTAFNPDAPGNPETRSIAPQQLRSHMEYLRLHAARRFKAALVSRHSIAPPRGSLRVMNRAGHQIASSHMFYLTTRKAMLDLFNEAQLDGLQYEGQATATVVHRDPSHATHGARIRLTNTAHLDLPTYAEVSDTWFHPRASAVIDRSR